MYTLSICADTIFLDLPFEARAEAIAAAGFPVEFWGWKGRNLDVFRTKQIPVATFSASGRGSLLHPDGAAAYVQDAIDTFPIAQQLNCRTLVIHEGELGEGGKVVHDISENAITRWITAYKGLRTLADFAEQNNVTYCLEVLNATIDHVGYCLNHIEDAVRLVHEVNSPNLKILMDIYHTQVDEGNVADLIRAYHTYIGHIHVADVPGRHEPGTGELNYPFIAKVLHEVGYTGVVGLEAYPIGDSHEAMRRFREAFTI
ncbi:MAG: TIM barrel protein [Anaerolineae bacterium]